MSASREREILRAGVSRQIVVALVNSGLTPMEQIAILTTQAADLARKVQREPEP